MTEFRRNEYYITVMYRKFKVANEGSKSVTSGKISKSIKCTGFFINYETIFGYSDLGLPSLLSECYAQPATFPPTQTESAERAISQ